jgi:hypothetical protein
VLYVHDLLESNSDADTNFAWFKNYCYTITSNHELNM